MTIARCIPGLVDEGRLTADQAARAEAIFGERVRHHERGMGRPAAEALASDEALEALANEAARKRRNELLSLRVQQDRLVDAARYRGGDEGPLSGRAVAAMIDRDEHAPFLNVEALRKAIVGEAHSQIDGILADHRRTVTGKLRNPAQMDEIGRAAFGETGNVGLAAREMADAWGRVAEWLRLRYNAAGGNIAKLQRWGLPQSHDSAQVRRAGWEAWRDEIWDRLDRERMIDEGTGLAFTDEALERVLRDVFETIRTDGMAGSTPGAGGMPALANRRQEHRFLQFRTYDDWAAYQARFGGGTAFDAMMGHIEGMARDIAAMEMFGPNPDHTLRWLVDGVEKQAALFGDDGGRAIDAAHAGRKKVERLWDEYTGSLRRPESRRIALGFGAFRSVQTAAKLGGAFLSSVSDFGTQAVTRIYNGLPATSMVRDYLRLMNPANEADRRFAVRRGLIAEEWGRMTAAQNRYLAEEIAGERASLLAEGVLRASGLSAHTQASRWSFGMEFLDTLQGEFGKSFDQLDGGFARVLDRYGFDASDWDAIRASTPSLEHRGELFLGARDITDARLRSRVLAMVQSETDFAVPTADLTTRSIVNSVAPKGTIVGELTRSAFLFKSFPMAILLSHGRRALAQQTWGGRLGYAAALTVATSIGGALAIQLKEIAKGRDPRPMDDISFVGAAVLQGGGLGIFGDFFGSAENRFGGGLASTLAGPVAQTVQNVGDLTIGNIAKAARGDETDVGKDVVKLLKQEVPGSSLWFARLAYERAVIDQFQELVDPDYRRAWRAAERRARDQGQEFYWEPGDVAPDRAPDFANLLGGDEQ